MFGQAADNTGPSQESPWTILQPLPTQAHAISNHTYRQIEIIGTAPGGIPAAIRNYALCNIARSGPRLIGCLTAGPCGFFEVLRVGPRPIDGAADPISEVDLKAPSQLPLRLGRIGNTTRDVLLMSPVVRCGINSFGARHLVDIRDLDR